MIILIAIIISGTAGIIKIEMDKGYEDISGYKSIDKNAFDGDITIAAHHEGEDWTEEELEDIKKFKEFLKARRDSKA
jgi:hypothetical protein